MGALVTICVIASIAILKDVLVFYLQQRERREVRGAEQAALAAQTEWQTEARTRRSRSPLDDAPSPLVPVAVEERMIDRQQTRTPGADGDAPIPRTLAPNG